MAAACELAEAVVQDGASVVTTLTETEIVAQAITELQQVCAPVNIAGESTTLVSVGETATGGDAAPLISCYFGTEDSGLSNEQTTTETDGVDITEPTQVIYYIEDGIVARTEKVLVDTSVQANDYEIERRSGRLPARRRVIPFKFRDFKNTSNDEDSDSDYEPDVKPKIKRIRREKASGTTDNTEHSLGIQSHRRPGRPRKNPLPSNYSEVARVVVTSTSDGQTQIEAECQLQNEADGQAQNEAGSEAEKKIKETNISILKDETETEETADHDTDDRPDEKDQVMYYPVRKGRGRPRGPNWRKDYKCPHCSRVFAQKGNLKTHIWTHTDERPFHCLEEECGKMFRSAESLRRHILSHRGIKPFECDVCHNKFSSNVGLQEHKSRHTDAKPHKCPHCPKHFRQISCLRRHVLTHSSDKPFGCNVCQQRFSQMAYLKSHMKVHTGEKPFQCDICQKRFAHQSDVKRHKIIHTGEKRYSCEICQAKFSDPSSKRRHEKEHSKKKSYVCQLCDETFRRGGQLKAHLTRKHMLAIQVETDKGFGNSSLLVDLQNESTGFTDSGPSNQRIVQLIKSLSTKTSLSSVDAVEVDIPPVNPSIIDKIKPENQSDPDTIATDHVTEISQLQKAGEVGLIESSNEVPIELQGIEIQEEEEGGQTYIAITDLAESLLPSKDSAGDGSGVYQYQIIQEIGENGNKHQVLIPYSQTANVDNVQVMQESIEENIVQDFTESAEVSEVTIASKELLKTVERNQVIDNVDESETEQLQAMEAVEAVEKHESLDSNEGNKTIVYDYVTNPDFSSQDYYNWLSHFTELCKVVPMPLDVTLFQKISQVHKTLSDVMATPSGVVADKENFRVLMNITKELSTIINEHLVFVLENLNPEAKLKDST